MLLVSTRIPIITSSVNVKLAIRVEPIFGLVPVLQVSEHQILDLLNEWFMKFYCIVFPYSIKFLLA
jgi:hypothetical protein